MTVMELQELYPEKSGAKIRNEKAVKKSKINEICIQRYNRKIRKISSEKPKS